jgi:hypothetical protein
MMASFEDVNVGDEVVIRPPQTRFPMEIARVERTTRTQFVAGGYRFRKDSGAQIGGDGWRFAHVYHPNLELLAKVKAEHRYLRAANNARQLRVQVETLLREIDRNPHPHHWAATLEAATEHLTAAVEQLKTGAEK